MPGSEDEEQEKGVWEKYIPPYVSFIKEARWSLQVHLGISHPKTLHWKGLG